MSGRDWCEVDVFFVRETDSAILVRDADDVEHWLPMSQVHSVDGAPGSHVTLELPEWLATDRGLI